MKSKRRIVIIGLVFLLFSIPLSASAQEKSDVGIGFEKDIYEPIREPTPINNVLPSTTRYNQATPYYSSGKSLPQTGSRQSRYLQLAGIFCLVAFFWLFLFLQLREEEEYE